ncbi:MAG: efflux RND transporter periplasmic adaptor subunit [Acidobacteriota bacterium]
MTSNTFFQSIIGRTALGLFVCGSLVGGAYVFANGEHEEPAAAGTGATTAVPIARAERNVDTDAGSFNFKVERLPSDPRSGELVQTALRIAEKVEGGFGGGEPIAITDAAVSLSVTTADGQSVVDKIPASLEGGFYRVDYTFSGTGNYKLVFNVTTKDDRSVSADFPVSVVRSAVNWKFWIGVLLLAFLSLGIVGGVYYAAGRDENGNRNIRKIAPVIILALVFFVFATFALAYFSPPRETRIMGTFHPTGEMPASETTVATLATITITKESQLLFGIKTEPVEVRKITSGLSTTGVVRARPDARAIVVPPVAGRIVLREGLSIGSAVTRGEQVGSVEQVLDVPGQVGLEQQRLEVEAKRIELRNTILQLQGQQAEQRAKANQARTQLAQAQRELRRAANLLEVGAAPKKRVEEAETAVRVAEQEVASSEQQVRLIGNQVSQTQNARAIFSPQRVNQPTRIFPLRAPVTGIVNEIKATSGQVVETGAELLSVVNLSTVIIEAQVFERDLPAVRESTRASFTNAALSGEVYTIGTPDGDGRLISIGQVVNEQTRTIPIIYEIKNPLGRLRDGMFVEVTIDTSGGRQVLAVPKRAVVTEQGQTFVFVFDGGESFEKRAVALGAEGADFYEIKSGLKDGERVVTEGIYQLRSTQPSA